MDSTIEENLAKIIQIKNLYFEAIKSIGSLNITIEKIQEAFDDYSANYVQLSGDFDKLTTDKLPLTIGIVGNSNSGKSSLINSLIGEDFLEIDELPATSRITVLSYEDVPHPKIFKTKKDGKIEEISYEDFKEFGHHRHEKDLPDETSDDIDHFDIFYPSDVFKKFKIIDTPGFSTVSEKDDELTKQYLNNKTDLLLWVFSASRGTLDQKELALLKEVENKNIVAIVNRMDQRPPSQRLDIIKNGFEAHHDFYKVLPYSAKEVFGFQRSNTANKKALSDVMDRSHALLANQEPFVIRSTETQLALSTSEGEIFEVPKTSVKRSEFVDYHHELMKLLDDLRLEVSAIKRQNFSNDLATFYTTERLYWIKLHNIFIELLDELNAQYKTLKDAIEKLTENINKRVDKYYTKLQKDLSEALFEQIYSFDYQEGTFWNPAKSFIRKNPLTESRLAQIKKTLISGFQEFKDNLVKDLKTGLAKIEIELDSNYEIEIIELLRISYSTLSYESILGMLQLWQDTEIDISYSKCKEIICDNLSLLIGDQQFCYLSRAFTETTLQNILETRRVSISKRFDTVEALTNLIKDTL